jgi:uncharacterized protein
VYFQNAGLRDLEERRSCSCFEHSPKASIQSLSMLNSKQSLKQVSLFSHFFLVLVKGYQVFLSPFLGGNCRYYPSCSNYALECFQSHPPTRAATYVFKRLLSCQPFSKKKLFDPPPAPLEILESRIDHAISRGHL